MLLAFHEAQRVMEYQATDVQYIISICCACTLDTEIFGSNRSV